MKMLSLLAVVIVLIIGWSWRTSSAHPPVAETKPVAITVVTLSEQALAETVPLQGTVFSRQAVEITPEVDGRISDIKIRSGQQVEQGDLLVQLDDRHQQAVLKREQAKLQDTIRHQGNIHRLLPKGAVTQSDVDKTDADVQIQQAEVELALAALEDRAIRAPFNGKVGLVDLSPGQLVSRETRLTTLDDATVLRLNVPVASKYLGRISTAQTVTLQQTHLNSDLVEAEITSIDSRVRGESLNVYLQLSIDNRDSKLTPGSLVTGRLKLTEQANVVLPVQSIAYEGHKRYAYRLIDDHVEKVEITLGIRDGDLAEVTSGLSAGEQVVHQGLVKVRDGMEVTVIARAGV
ncbi:efflux RND transporter periplasmic adaptor subunit [Corallincola holothuriorum]|uniref:Efflux RND transporter periplasmic adaptor subunit n=1 Tax=Corallincola holothuriorum TaxID=2282215 RepID=A0A368NJR9_9GAMM|nr:efflux RND transporter periplasmic adaptor subunit [Corallincola holothuriorum]RCU50350.1 efflux RND transporter periplasmic adaptor subunit [Corallincola holothuriorum]